MKRLAVAGLLLALACVGSPKLPGAPSLPGVVTLQAQSLPVTRTLLWDPPALVPIPGQAGPPVQLATGYVVTLDGTTIGTITNVATTSQAFTVTTDGPHVLVVVAQSPWGPSPSLPLNFVVSVPPAPTNARIQ